MNDSVPNVPPAAAREHVEPALTSEAPDARLLLSRIRATRERAAGVYVTDADLGAARDEGRP